MTALHLLAALALAQAAPGSKLLTLDEAVREAQARSADLQAVRARLDQARTIGWKAWSNQLPQVKAGASYTRNPKVDPLRLPTGYNVDVDVNVDTTTGAGTGTGTTTSPTNVIEAVLQKENQLGAQVEATMPLVAPSLWFGISAARHGEKQAGWSLESARREILFGVAQLYYGAAGGKYAVRITEKQLSVALDHEKDARVRYQAGTTPKVALLRAEIDRSKAEQDLKAAQAGYDSARTGLATLLDRKDIDFEVEVPAEQPAPAGDLEASALQRPDVLAAREAVGVAEGGRGAVWARYLPSLGAFGRWQWANLGGFTGRQDSWAVGLGLSWSLFDGTLREAELKENGAKVAEAEAGLRAAEARAREEVKRGQLDLDTALAIRQKAKETVELARENHRLVEVNYKAGAATYLEVSDAQNQLLTAELANLTEDLRARLVALRLLKAAGRFDPK